HPCTATHSPAATRPCVATARNAVAKRQPRAAAPTKPSPDGSPTRFVSASSTTTYSANEPGSVKPGCSWLTHTCPLPPTHSGQRPHAYTNGAVTRSPTAHA